MHRQVTIADVKRHEDTPRKLSKPNVSPKFLPPKMEALARRLAGQATLELPDSQYHPDLAKNLSTAHVRRSFSEKGASPLGLSNIYTYIYIYIYIYVNIEPKKMKGLAPLSIHSLNSNMRGKTLDRMRSHNIVRYTLRHLQNQDVKPERINFLEESKSTPAIAPPMSIADIFGNIARQIAIETQKDEEEHPERNSERLDTSAKLQTEESNPTQRALCEDEDEDLGGIKLMIEDKIEKKDSIMTEDIEEENQSGSDEATHMIDEEMKQNKIFQDQLLVIANNRKAGRLRKSMKIKKILILPDDPWKIKWNIVMLMWVYIYIYIYIVSCYMRLLSSHIEQHLKTMTHLGG